MIVIERLFSEVKTIRMKYELLANITGENFNIFHILGLQTDEVRLHSAFLAELLNPNGSHNQGDRFLTLFINQLKINNFSTTSAKIFVEYFTTKISTDGENGGRIDILLKDLNNKQIIIENKIYAIDQPKQLIRYKNFDKSAVLLYLNLFGEISKDLERITDKLIVGTDYQIISYEKHIIEWLEVCMKEAAVLPIIRETIHQYINLIKRLTNQSTFKSMNTEIINLFRERPEYFKTVPSIEAAYKEIIKIIYDQFFTILGEKLIEKGLELSIEDSNLIIQLTAGEGDSGFYFAYRIVLKDNSERCNIFEKLKNSKKQNPIIPKTQRKDLFEKYSKIINGIIEGAEFSEYSLVFYNPPEFAGHKKLYQIDVNRYIGLYDKEKCNDFIDNLLRHEIENFEKIKKEIVL